MDRLNKWLGLIANLGVLVGLSLLVYELKQARDLAVFETVQANRDHRIQMFTNQRDSEHWAPIITKLRDSKILTPEESARWKSHLSVVWAITFSEWVYKDMDLISKYSNLEFSVPLALTTPGSLDFWESTGKHIYSNEFVRFVEEKRANLDP